jgi:hypothetical protein
VRLKLKSLRSDIEAGVRAPASYTVQAAVDDWLAEGLPGRSERTLTLYRGGVKPLTDKIGARQLRKLTAAEVRSALTGLSGELSTRSLQIAHNCEAQACSHPRADHTVLVSGPGNARLRDSSPERRISPVKRRAARTTVRDGHTAASRAVSPITSC